jgi:hypothetical protein
MTPAQIRTIRKMFNDGCKDREIAAEIGCKANQVYYIRRTKGMDRPSNRIPLEQKAEIERLIHAGFNDSQIAEKLNIPLSRPKNRRYELSAAGEIQKRGWERKSIPQKHGDGERTSFIAFADRRTRMIEHMADNLGQPIEWVQNVWMQGPAGREAMRNCSL